MTEVLFYHLQRQPLEAALPMLDREVGRTRLEVAVQAASAERVAALDDHLWTYAEDSFLPHCNDREPDARDQPVVLTLSEANPNGASIRFLVEGAAVPPDATAYAAPRRAVRRKRPGRARAGARAVARPQGRGLRCDLLAAGRARPLGAEGVIVQPTPNVAFPWVAARHSAHERHGFRHSPDREAPQGGRLFRHSGRDPLRMCSARARPLISRTLFRKPN